MKKVDENQATTVDELMRNVMLSDEEKSYAEKKWTDRIISTLKYGVWDLQIIVKDTGCGWREVDISNTVNTTAEFFYKVLPFMMESGITRYNEICSAYGVSTKTPFCLMSNKRASEPKVIKPRCISRVRLIKNDIKDDSKEQNDEKDENDELL